MRKNIASRDLRLRKVVLQDLGLAPGRQGAVYRFDVAETGLKSMPFGHRHRQWETNLIVQGWTEYVLNGRRAHLTAGTVAWLLPCQAHLRIDSSQNLVMWVVVFEPSVARNLAADGEFTLWRQWLRMGKPSDPAERIIDEPSVQRIAALCSQLVAKQPETVAETAAITWLIADAWTAYQCSNDAPVASNLHPAVEKAARILHKRPELDDLKQVADECSISRAHLSRLFQQSLGQSMTEFRNRQRVDRFLAMCRPSHRIKATQAAYAAGFGSYTQAYRVVREITGRSPRELRR